MKKICLFLFFITSINMYSQKYVLLEINSKWNSTNPAKIAKLQNVQHKKAYLEDQPENIRNKVRAVPFVVLYKDGKPIGKWSADITFKLSISLADIQKAILKSNK
uniref:Thioredoxin n=1 Tax=uncultured marine virus TaxID=186617 RepID=A0A0F7L6D9_9VIRU|nr:hypothetical protein [uncultured marine virus]